MDVADIVLAIGAPLVTRPDVETRPSKYSEPAEILLELAPATATPTARSGCWSRTSDIRSPRTPDIRSAWTADIRRAGNWDIDIQVYVDDIRDPNRQPRIDVYGRRRRKLAYNRIEVPVHARGARWWRFSATDRRRGEFDQRQIRQHGGR